jgi:CheY-like chemotaxis protein
MGHTCEILIVDDETIICERLKVIIEKEGHRVETFTDPGEALKRLDAKDFDIVISDIRMGEIDGIQVLEKVFDKSEQIKVIMITGYATMELARESMAKARLTSLPNRSSPKKSAPRSRKRRKKSNSTTDHRLPPPCIKVPPPERPSPTHRRNGLDAQRWSVAVGAGAVHPHPARPGGVETQPTGKIRHATISKPDGKNLEANGRRRGD